MNTFMRLPRLAHIICVCCGVALAAPAQTPPTFAKIAPKLERATALSMAASPDGKYLFIAYTDKSSVVVWDIAKAAIQTTLQVDNPVGLLVRDEQVMVSSRDKGIITLFSLKDWSKSSTIQLPEKSAWLLSAPVGDYYHGKVLAACETGLLIVDVRKGKATTVPANSPQLTFGNFVSADGRSFSSLDKVLKAPILDGGPLPPDVRGTDARYAHAARYQRLPGSLWFHGLSVLADCDDDSQALLQAEIQAVPDSSVPLFYLLSEKKIQARRLDLSMQVVGEREVQLPPGMERYGKPDKTGKIQYYLDSEPNSRMRFGPMIAITVGKDLYWFLLEGGQAWWAKLPAFDTPTSAPVAKPDVLALAASPYSIDAFEFSEDGTQLFASSQASQSVLVLDVRQNTLLRQVHVSNPGLLLCRDGLLFVADQQAGTINVLSLKDYKLKDQLSAGKGTIEAMSAGRGKGFANKLLVKLSVKANASDFTRLAYVVVDTTADRVSSIAMPPDRTTDLLLASDGQSVVINSNALVPLNGLLARKVEWNGGGARSDRIVTAQYWPGYWTGPHAVLATPAFTPLLEAVQDRMIIVPDACEPQIFDLSLDRVAVRKLDSRCTVLSQTTVDAADFVARVKAMDGSLSFAHSYPACGVTLNGRSYVYVLYRSLLYRMELAPSGGDGVASGQLPAYLTVGQKFRYKTLLPSGESYTGTLLSGPASVKLGANGLVEWTPAPQDLGQQVIKVRWDSANQAEFFRMRVGVLPEGTDLTKLPLRELPLVQDATAIIPSAASVLVLAGPELKVLSPDGRKLVKTVQIPNVREGGEQGLRLVLERPGYYIGLVKDNRVVLIDKTTSTITKTIALPGPVTDMVCLPNSAVTFASVKSDEEADRGTLLEYRIVALNERIGTVQKVDKGYGQHLAMAPSGRSLYATLYDTTHRGLLIDRWGGAWEVRTAASALLCYAPHEMTLKPIKAVETAHASGLYFSGSGKSIVCATNWGLQTFAAETLKAGEYPNTNLPRTRQMLAVHPQLPLFAAAYYGELQTFDFSAKPLKGVLDLGGEVINDVQCANFTADGNALLVSTRDRRGRPILRIVDIRRDAPGLGKLATTVPSGSDNTSTKPIGNHPAPAGAADRKDLLALEPLANATKLTAREIGRQYLDAVVEIHSGETFGSGVCVGNGYILTCAHVLGGKKTSISYRKAEDKDIKPTKVDAKVVLVDRKADLALLHAELPQLPVAHLSDAKLESGESVTVIGNPGLGSKPLAWTLTQGVVSSVSQKIDGKAFIQFDAAVNLGSSGGPVLDESGRLIGIVVQKGAQVERIGLAVPAGIIRAFLESASGTCTTRPTR